jgi:homoserine acetyltransferase
MEEIHQAIKSAGASCEHKILKSDFGHGAFIYDFEGLGPVIRDFLS